MLGKYLYLPLMKHNFNGLRLNAVRFQMNCEFWKTSNKIKPKLKKKNPSWLFCLSRGRKYAIQFWRTIWSQNIEKNVPGLVVKNVCKATRSAPLAVQNYVCDQTLSLQAHNKKQCETILCTLMMTFLMKIYEVLNPYRA